MEYQEIVTAYKKDSLDTNDLKKELEKARPLRGRSKYRALSIANRSIEFNTNATNITSISETAEKVAFFDKELENILVKYYLELVSLIDKNNAWIFANLSASEHTEDNFRNVSTQEKFRIIFEMNKKYLDYLEIQKLADIKEHVMLDTELTETEIKQIAFLRLMFEALDNDFVKKEFYCFDEKFLRAIVEFKKGKVLRIEEFMKTKSKAVQYEYEKNKNFFTTEDYRDIEQNLILSSKTLKRSITTIIRYFAEISESEAEEDYLKVEAGILKELEEKYLKMDALRKEIKTEESSEKSKEEKDNAVLEKYEKEKIQAEKKKREDEERKQAEQVEQAEKEKNRIIEKTEGSTGEMDNKIEELKQTQTVKEQVIPLIFSWLEREDISLTKRIGGSKKLSEFFEKIKQIEKNEGVRVSLFLVTNTGKEVTKKRVSQFQEKAKEENLPRLIEGALGGYSAFRVDSAGRIIDMAKMSKENRRKIINLVEKSKGFYMPQNLIDETEDNYLRYEFSGTKDSSITKQYLGIMISRLLSDEKIKRQPLKFVPYIERNSIGIDVLLESQVKGISQIADYYKIKYEIDPEKTLKTNINTIDEFIDNSRDEHEEH